VSLKVVLVVGRWGSACNDRGIRSIKMHPRNRDNEGESL